MKTIYSFLFLFIAFSACKKTEEPAKIEKRTSDLFPLKINENTIGLITILHQTYEQHLYKDFQVDASFQNPYYGSNSGNIVDAGFLIINKDTIHKNLDFRFDENMDASKIENYFGNKTSYTISGNSNNEVDFINEEIYIPKEIQMITANNEFLSKNNSDTIRWNSDTNYKEKIYLEISYNGISNHRHDNSLPNTDIWHQEHIIDNGIYVIPKSVLEKMPTNATIQILIARSAYRISTQKNGKEIHFLATTFSESEFTLTK